NLAGSYFGSRSFEIGGVKVVRPIMCVVLALFFVRVITDLFFGAAGLPDVPTSDQMVVSDKNKTKSRGGRHRDG
ncbi:MAG: hypothetical protein IJR68_06365, partial [Fretibacterium sp.]|nr:hypothetical protein [Fretibacterium sp.]